MSVENFVVLRVRHMIVVKYVSICDVLTNVRKNMGVGVNESRQER